MGNRIVISADIGGSHISSAAVDIDKHGILPDSLVRRSLDSRASLDEVISAWSGAIHESAKRVDAKGYRVSLAMPGPYDYENGISYIKENNKYEALYGVNVKGALSEKLLIAAHEIRMKNDAACFLRGEVLAGAAQGSATAVGVTLGTGVGTSFLKKGICEDADWWQRPFRDSIAENYFSTQWFKKTYHEMTGYSIDGVKALIERHQGDHIACAIFSIFASNLAMFLEDFTTEYDAEVVVIGGNITRSSQLFLPEVKTILGDRNIKAEIRLAQLGENAAILGASACWLD